MENLPGKSANIAVIFYKQQAVMHNDDDPQFRCEIGQLTEKLGKIEIARSCYKAAGGMTNAKEEARSYSMQLQAMQPSRK